MEENAHVQPVVSQEGQQAPQPDFTHRFLTSTEPFLVDENDYYRLETNHEAKRIYLYIKQYWHNYISVPELENHLRTIAGLMQADFTLLIDETTLLPDSDGKVEAPAIPARDILLNAGLLKVADVIPHNCQELVHGTHSFSINSIRIRQFHSQYNAEQWLNSD